MRGIILSVLVAFALSGPASAEQPAGQVSADTAAFTLTNDGEVAAPVRIVSFGHVFAPGTLAPGRSPRVKLQGLSVATQTDAKAFYPDGSVRHAILSIAAPPLRAHANAEGLIETAGAGPAPPPAATTPAAPALRAILTFRSGPAAGQAVSVDLQALARDPARSPPWLSGSLVREQRYWAPPVYGVQVAFDVWSPAVGAPRVDVILHNDLAQDAMPIVRRYDLDLVVDGQARLHVADVAHHPYALWRRTLYLNGLRPDRVTPDTVRLARLGASPDYLRLKPDGALAAKLHASAVGDVRPLPVAGLTPYMPTSGGRPDIGPLPTWAVIYLLAPTRQNAQTLFANAEAAGSIPWHVRDATTNAPLRIDQHPGLWLDARGAPGQGLAAPYQLPDTPWQPDTAHQPSLAYLPYLLTGSQFYRDELAAEAAFALLAVDPQYRGGAQGVVIGQQVRQVAWTLRTLGAAAWILPTSDFQRYLANRVDANLDAILRRYVRGREAKTAGELIGYLPGPYGVEGAVAPWQGDYLAMVLGWLQAMGYRQSKPILYWMANFTAGRFTNGARGYDPIYGTPYYLFVADPRSGAPLSRWSDAFKATFDPAKPVTSLDYPDWAGGYSGLARGALASIANVTGDPSTLAAYAYVKAHSPGIDANYAKDPTFAIALRPAAEAIR